MSEFVAFVLARGGSKRVPRKNARLFCGKPMIAWPVSQVYKSGLFSSVIISTDDREIANIAVKEGAVFFSLRPPELCNDFVGTEEVLTYELEQYKIRNGVLPEYCCCLYGTSAFVSSGLLQKGVEQFLDKEIELVMAVIAYSHPIERALYFDSSGLLQYHQPEFVDTRTQDIPVSYYDAGLFYWIKSVSFLKHKNFSPLIRSAIVVDAFSVIDIDNESDWHHAEILARLNGFASLMN